MLQTLISLIFYLGFMIYIFLGIYSITLNIKDSLNRVFLLLCLCISFWAFTFAVGNSASTYEGAFLWRRISSLGWGIAFSLITHFVLVLTEEKGVLKAKWLYAALYLPASVNVFIFGLSGKLAREHFYLVHTPAGWASLSLSNTGDIYFNLYYSTFSLLTFILLLRWHKKTRDLIKKKYAEYFLTSFGVSMILGTFTDNLANRYLTFKIPSLAPIIILIPVSIIFYIIHRYGLMQPQGKKLAPLDGVILSDDKRVSLFRYISMAFFIVSFFNLLLHFFYSVQWVPGFFLSAVLVLSGAVIFVMPTVSTSPKIQENVLMLLTAVVLPLILLFHYNQSMSNMVWPVPLFVMVVAIIFNNRKMFSILAVISLLIGIGLWIKTPEMVVHVRALHYVLRIVFYGIGIILTSYINKIYISRLNENEKQVRFQKMVSTISTDFITVTSSNLDDKIKALLETSGHYTQADRSYLGIFDEDLQRVGFTHEWLGEGIQSVMEDSTVLQAKPYTWAKNKILSNEIVFIPEVKALPMEAKMEKEIMLVHQIKSLILIPISNKDKVIGFIGFDQVKEQKIWRVEDYDLLKVLANILSDAMAKVEVEKNIKYLAYYDRLTDIPNRVLFNIQLEEAVHRARQSEKLIGVMFIDLDGFKAVNDTLGHDWGDYLLKQVADRLSHCIEKSDTVARFGGDEYLVMIPEVSNVEHIEEAAKRIMKVFEKPIVVNEQEFFITASGGIAVFPADGEDAKVLVKNADLAMYSAKANGKSKYAFCSTGMKEDVLKKMRLTNSLYRVLDKGELQLYYQPQVSIKTKEVVGMEALIRWNHPDLGRIPPDVFIPIAEQTGLINPIGEWCLRTACRQNKAWQELGYPPVKMAVNISVEQFRSGSLMQIVKECLDESGLSPRFLELEITEGIAMKEASYINRALAELKSLGVAISIDDFGTEYSSLSRLKDLPVDRLKLDMQFIHGISVNSKDESIISVIIHLARSLGLRVIAEGVETETQLDFLTKEACDEVQGYYYYKPMSKEDIEGNVFRG